jgi:hypothetical protein
VDPAERRTRFVPAAVALLVVGYSITLFSHASRSVGGSDSSGYLNAARALARGEPVERVEPLARFGFPQESAHLFIPLGYVPGVRPGTMATFYPVGLPLQILAAAALFGWRVGPFLVSPFFATASVLFLYLLARNLGVTRLGSLACAAMLACSPVLAFQGVQLMSDTAAVAWALATMLCAVKSRQRIGWAALAGLAFGVGVLVRPASAILLVPLVFTLPVRPRAWLLFGAGGAPFAAFFVAFNKACYGGAFRTGYDVGGALTDFARSNFPPRFRHYLYWISAMLTPLVPAAWLLLTGDRWRPLRLRLMLLTWFGAFFFLYCFYGPYETWWYTRYLLPGFPALLIAAVMLAEDALRRLRERADEDSAARRRTARLATAGLALAAAAVCFAGLRLARRFDVLEMGRGQATFPESIRWASGLVPERSVVLAMEFSGAMRAYGWGTFVRWDYIDVGQFPGVRSRFKQQGYRVYALLQPHEVLQAAPRVPGRWTYLGSNRDVSLWRLD